MSLEERAKATAKNIEGKAQELGGKITGDVGEQAKGKAKQGEASVRHAAEDVKDELKEDKQRDY
ncbi:CsbD family protein [Pannus brasiliensis CCIBt3594]|uniref:CsbD family protein n=1 Tax=Pannus brasiliensis CCIBt3594 TaxID=1427578 RepID=A0AAW9QVZ3_9CHRO